MLVVDVCFVVTVTVEKGVVVVVVVDESAGFQMLNTQKVGSVMGADSGPGSSEEIIHVCVILLVASLTTKLSSTCHT